MKENVRKGHESYQAPGAAEAPLRGQEREQSRVSEILTPGGQPGLLQGPARGSLASSGSVCSHRRRARSPVHAVCSPKPRRWERFWFGAVFRGGA